MNALARFEGFMQGLMDRRVVRLLGGSLQPVELAQGIARCMEQQQSPSPAGPTVPNRFRLLLHPGDYADLRALDPALERKLVQYTVELARERGFNFPAAPEVSLAADAEVEPGAVRVEAAVTEREKVHGMPGSRRSPWQRPAGGSAPLYFDVPAAPGATSLPLDHFPFVIGRREGHDLVLPDARVSRDHAVVELLDGRYRLRDLGSRNGTFVNDEAVSEVDLRDGDRLAIGGFEVTVRIPASAA